MSKHIALALAVIVTGAVASSSAFALDIVNKDKHNHNVRFVAAGAAMGTKPTEEKVAAGATVTTKFDCSKGCTAHIGKKDDPKKDVVLKGDEKQIVIEGDKLSLPKS